ncbi:MAG TPA: penicillin-binding protein 2 [Longimicrobiales bacterium]
MERTGRLTTPRAQRVRRSRGARAVVILTVMFLTGALARLQVVNGDELAKTSRTNRMRPLTVPAPRGTIYDRHGQIIAENVPAYQIQIMPDAESTRTGKPSERMRAQIDSLRPILGLTDDHITVAIRKWRLATNYPMPLMTDAPAKAIARLQERSYMFPEVVINEYAKRSYPAGSAIAHLIGYVAEIDARDTALARFKGYEQGRLIGKAGLEREYEELLGGTPGKRYMKVDASGKIIEWLPDAESLPPIPGRDLQLSLDLDLQKYVEELFNTSPDLAGKNGAFVALDPATGGVLALYSQPSYDPNLFTGGIDYENFNRLNTDPDKPLLNRASGTGARQPPASTWKLMMSAMALDLGVIKPEEYMPIPCTGGMTFGRYAKCWGVHGPQNLVKGILNSCDVYFYQVGIRIGLKRFMEVGTRMGFPEPTGIDLPAEQSNTFPKSMEWFEKNYGYAPNENEIMTMSIGQGAVVMTPIKMAQMYVALARPDGVAFEPRLAMFDEPPKVSFKLNVTDENLDYMRQGMRLVVGPGGTAALSRLENWDFLGKTGTAQSCQGCPASTDHAWFVGMAGPRGKHPEIVAAMFVQYGEHGYVPSGHVGNAINFYLNRKYGKPFERYPIPRDRNRLGLPTGSWVYSPVTQYKMDDHDTYPTIDKLQAYWQQRGKSIEGLAAAVKPTPAAPAPSTEKAADSASGKPASRR